MKTFKKIPTNRVFNAEENRYEWVYSGEFSNRSLVVLIKNGSNPDKGTFYNLATKCRSTDMESIIRAMTRMILAEMREMYLQNNTKAATESKRKVGSELRKMLRGTEIMVANRYGNIIKGAGIKCCDEQKLSDIFKFNASMPLYIRVVEKGEPWDSEKVQTALKWYITATMEQMDYINRLDNALAHTADVNDKDDVELHEEFAEPAADVAEPMAEAV